MRPRTPLRLGERGLFRPLWSADILEEPGRNLSGAGIADQSVERLIGGTREAFLDAEATGHRPLIDPMACDPKDRHVLAAAVAVPEASDVAWMDVGSIIDELQGHIRTRRVRHPKGS